MTIVLMLALVGVTAATFAYFNKNAIRKRRLRDAKPWPIRELPEDTFGRVIGRAQIFEETLTAPLTGRECVWYSVKVFLLGDSPNEVINHHEGVPFLLEDETGRAIIDPTGAETVVTCDAVTESGTWRSPEEAEKALLSKFGGTAPRGWLSEQHLKYEESIIHPGETITVLGAGVREPDPDARPTDAYRGDQPTRLRLASSATFPLLISDDPSTTAG